MKKSDIKMDEEDKPKIEEKIRSELLLKKMDVKLCGKKVTNKKLI